MALEELQDVPLYYELPRLTNIVKLSSEKLTVYTSAILNAGYRFSLSHANKAGLKTTAPLSFLWDIMRLQGQKNSKGPLGNLSESSPGYKIMSKAPTSEISFELHPDANPKSREDSLKRFQINPEANWGPKARSRTSLIPEKSEKQVSNQGKQMMRRRPMLRKSEEVACAADDKDPKKLKCDKLEEEVVVQPQDTDS